MVLAVAGAIHVKSRVQHPVQAGLDRPTVTDRGEDDRVERHRGDVEPALSQGLAFPVAVA
jgi:hypothetical protein